METILKSGPAQTAIAVSMCESFIAETAHEKQAEENSPKHNLIIEECCDHMNVCELKIRIKNNWL